ncbi:MAG: hypothetical protein NVSMB23_28440 [Myxococcales bacterium]
MPPPAPRQAPAPKPQAVAPQPQPQRSLVSSWGPSLEGCPVFPADNAFNTDISDAPVDPHSWQYMNHMASDWMKLRPDFGPPEVGKPITVVDGWQALVPIHFQYAGDSDPGPYPLPLDLAIQGGLGDDRHAIVVDRGHCKAYETFATYRSGNGFWAGSGAVFDLRSNKLRPDGWTSSVASGLPLIAGLVRYDEVAEQGVIRHALLFGATTTAHGFVHPATHSSGNSWGPWAPPMGTRVRLKRDFDLSRFSGQSLIILRAMQRYGMFLVDNQNDPFWSVGGARDHRWDRNNLLQLRQVPASAFEVVEMGRIHPGP